VNGRVLLIKVRCCTKIPDEGLANFKLTRASKLGSQARGLSSLA